MARYAAVMTTNVWDPFVEAQFRRTAANVRSGTTFVLTHAAGSAVPLPPWARSLAVDEGTVRQIGLPIEYQRTLFCYNVDYLYYAFFHAHPDYDYYVFFDYPAVIDLDLDEMVASIARDELDFVAQPVAGPIGDWVYAKAHRDLYPPGALHGAALPLAILSKAALAYLFERRLHLARALVRGAVAWPFCEAFVPSELARMGFRSAPLSAYGSVDAFSWWPPVLDATLPTQRRPGFIHPLLDPPRYLRSMLEHARSRDLLSPRTSREILRHVPLRDYLPSFLAQLGANLWRAIRTRLHSMRQSAGPSRVQG